jgi:NAD(P)H-hydrate epimerase
MPLPVISVAQMREWENASWAAGRSPAAVIKNVGRSLARRALDLTFPGETILILAGRGHNGDDARAARSFLAGRSQMGDGFRPRWNRRKVVLVEAADPRTAAREFSRSIQLAPGRARPRLVVDGLFGIGLNRPLDGPWKTLIDTVNQSGLPVLSVDVPSGLNADNGQVEGAAIRAQVTLTVGAPKRGLLLASEWVGRLEVAPDIGLIPCPVTGDLNWTLPEDFAAWPPRRPVESNKGTFGHAAIIAGSLGYHGAAVLAARGALRAQPGLVTVEPQESVYLPVAAQLQAAMARPWRAGRPLPKNSTAILFGPGLAADHLPAALKKELRVHWKNFPGPMIVDASALDWLEPDDAAPALRADIIPSPREAGRGSGRGVPSLRGLSLPDSPGGPPAGPVRVITPHPGEAGRLLGISAQEVQADRVAALRQLSSLFGNCYVVLKGHHTLVGRAGGAIFINCSGNPLLAQGGSGDLLGGYLAGLLAQPACQQDPLTAIRFAVWQHGAAADDTSQCQHLWTVEDMVLNLGSVRP